MGIVWVARWSAAVTGVEFERIRSGFRVISSLANFAHQIDISAGPTDVHQNVASVSPARLRKAALELKEQCFRAPICLRQCHQHADTPNPFGLLGMCRQRPSGGCAEEECYEFAPSHSITSSARARNDS